MGSGLPQMAGEPNMPDMPVVSMHPRFRTVRVQLAARNRLWNSDFPGGSLYFVVRGRLRQYNSVGSIFTRKNCVWKLATAGLIAQLTRVASSNFGGSPACHTLGQMSPQFRSRNSRA